MLLMNALTVFSDRIKMKWTLVILAFLAVLLVPANCFPQRDPPGDCGNGETIHEVELKN